MSNTGPLTTTRLIAVLGYGGLLPFVGCLLLMSIDHERRDIWHGVIRAYGAVILSFVGALHWGFATALDDLSPIQRRALFVWSIVPCLIAFAALLLHSPLSDLFLLSGYFLHYVQDAKLAALTPLPRWYLPLRLCLSGVAMLCIGAAGVLGFRPQ